YGDTGEIIPKQFLRRIERTGFGQLLFYHWRFDDQGQNRPDCNLDDETYAGATMLVAGGNCGCGSAREHAPCRLLDCGFRVIIAPSCTDIFYNNTLKNGIRPIKMDAPQLNEWMKEAEENSPTLSIDLKKKQITQMDGKVVSFDIPAYHQEKLLNGWDDIALTLHHEDKIKAYETNGR